MFCQLRSNYQRSTLRVRVAACSVHWTVLFLVCCRTEGIVSWINGNVLCSSYITFIPPLYLLALYHLLCKPWNQCLTFPAHLKGGDI